ncbi:hypothetical protein [uncultured Fretibacterium sp.]|uniref:hypothetical protein n=1 Tax=uncultured Fretibacterium sp. TaxID=1678694 RepID=UPI002620CA64|nr:hypothetical protein [uncultured Fretibacterium sp.]
MAVLAAVFALGLAGTALADPKAWVGSTGGDWKEGTNWNPNGVPAAADEVLISGAEVKITEAANAKSVSLGQGATLSIEGTGKLTLAAGGALHASGDATVEVKAVDGLTFTTATHITVNPDKALTLKRKAPGNIKGAGAMTLSGGGTLNVNLPLTTATGLEIKDGSTLNVVDTLPDLTGPAVTVTKGNLTLGYNLPAAVKRVEVTEGVLTVGQGRAIGNGSKTAPDGAVDLKDKGRLVLSGDLTLKELKTVDGSKITANGNVLTIIDPTNPFVLDAGIDKGTLSLDVAAGQMATLSKDVAKVVFNGKNGGAPTLKFEERVFVNHLDIRGSTTEPAKLQFGGENTIGTLEFVRTTPLVVSYSDLFVKVEKLILADGAALDLKLMGGTALTIKDGTPGAKWNVKMGNENTDFRVHNAGLLSGNVEVTLGGGTLYLPHGAYPNLTLKAVSPPVQPTLEADVFEGDPVLTVGKVEISGSDMRMKATGVWKRGLEAGKTLTLLKVNSVNMNGKVIKGDPEQDKTPSAEYWKVARLEGTKTELVLTALKTISVPDLVAEASYSGNKRTVTVKVSGDVKVKEGEWKAEMIRGDRPENYPAYENAKPGTNTREGAVFEVMLPSGFTSGTLRVKATNFDSPNFQGFVDVPLERTTPGGGGGGGGGGGTPGTPGTPAAPSIDPSSWETTAIGEPDAQGNLTVQLTATLRLDGTPKSLDVVASGMKEKPKAELLDAGGKVIVSSMPPAVRAGAKSYRLRLTCRTTKADIDSGRAAIEKVLVATDDGKVHTIMVNKKLKDIAKPGGNPGQPGNPGNPGQPDNPGD